MFFAFFTLCLRREWWRVCVGLQRRLAWTLARTWVTFRGVFMNKLVQRRFFPNGTRLDLHRNRVSAVCLSGGIIQRDRSGRAYTHHTIFEPNECHEWVEDERESERKRGSGIPTALLVQWRSSDGRAEPGWREARCCVWIRWCTIHSFDVRASDKIDTVTYRQRIKELRVYGWIPTILKIDNSKWNSMVFFFSRLIIYMQAAMQSWNNGCVELPTAQFFFSIIATSKVPAGYRGRVDYRLFTVRS